MDPARARRDRTLDSELETGDLEDGGDESEPLLPMVGHKSMQIPTKRWQAGARPSLQHAPSSKMLSTKLEKLQDPVYLKDHFSALNADEVTRAASLLQKVTECGDLEVVEGREEYQEVVFFKRRPMQTATLLHFAIWFVSEHSADTDIVEDVLRHLGDPDDALWPASYSGGTVDGVRVDAYVSAVHIAASLGQVAILKILLKHATEMTSPAKRMTKDVFVSEWAKLLPISSTGEDYFDHTNENSKQLYYQPIHDSTYAGNGEVTLWLLRQQADPCARNNKDITPLHFVAFSGLMGGLGASLGEDLAKIVKSLQRTGNAVGAKANMSLFIPDARDVTPLEVAVQDASRFPQDHLGLLAPCLADSHGSLSYFDDVKHIAEVTPDGALNLVRNIAEKGKENHHVLRRLRICAQLPGQSDQLARIFYTAPLAASELLDLLEVEPLVEDPAHHTLPTKTSLWGFFQNVPMRCTYQHDFLKKEGLMMPFWAYKNRPAASYKRKGDSPRNHEFDTSNWHEDFLNKTRPQARASYIKRVRVVASLMPGILDIDVFMAFAQCQHEHLAIMSKKTVQGSIVCLWGNVIEHVWAIRGIFLFFDMGAYVTVSGLIQADMHQGSLCWPIIAASNFTSVITLVSHNVSLLTKWSSHGSDSIMSAMWSPLSRWNLFCTVGLGCHTLLGTIFVVDMYVKTSLDVQAHDRTYLDDVLLAACLLMSCFRFIWMWRLSTVGSRIYSICQTFLAGAVFQVLFITFLLLFSFICALMVLSRVHTARLAVLAYRGFLFGDGDGFNGVGMHLAEDDSSEWGVWPEQNGALIAFAVFGSFFFNVIVLNIIIAIYGNEYDRVQPETPGLFMQGRADYCVKSILSTYVIAWRGETFNELLIVGSLISILAGVVLGKFGINMFMSATMLTFGQVLLPMAMIQCSWFSPEGQDADDRARYLWMCHPRDWHWTTDAKIGENGDDGDHAESEIDEKLFMLDDKVNALDDKMKQMIALLQPGAIGATPMGPAIGLDISMASRRRSQ